MTALSSPTGFQSSCREKKFKCVCTDGGGGDDIMSKSDHLPARSIRQESMSNGKKLHVCTCPTCAVVFYLMGCGGALVCFSSGCVHVYISVHIHIEMNVYE